MDENFPKQAEAIKDLSRFQVWNASRRSGKTQGAARRIVKTLNTHHNARGIYFALTAMSAKEIIWDELINLCDSLHINIKPNIAERTILFKDTNSKVKIAGADASEREMKKVLGQKLIFVFVDEAGSFTIDMPKFIYQMIRPTLIDLRGDLILLGTCETIPNTFFQKCIDGIEKGWKLHKWTAYDNPYMAVQWKEEIDLILSENPKAADAAWFRTHYMNEWIKDDDMMVIMIKDHTIVEHLPVWKQKNYILGVDLGYNDATAFSVLSYSWSDKKAIVEYANKDKAMDITDTANEIKRLMTRFPFVKMIVDGANKQAVEEMKRRHGLPLESAEKTDKAMFLRMMRDDVIMGNLLLYRYGTHLLKQEWDSLVWKDSDKDVEDGRCENHISDATLYAWRHCYHYLYQPPEKKLDPHSEEYMENYWENEDENLTKQLEEENEDFGI